MDDFIFDYESGNLIFKISDDMATDLNGNFFLRTSDNVAMDLSTGNFHFTSPWPDKDNSDDDDN